MKNHSDGKYNLRNDRSTWITVAAILSGCALASSASAQLSISDSATAPTSDILTSQLTDLGPGTQDSARDYMNNGGAVGQTFEVGGNSTLDAITVLGRGDAASSWTTGPQPFVAGTTWGIQISTVNPITGALTTLDNEQNSTYVPTGGGVDDTDYLTYDLANPVSLTAGVEYAFNVWVDDSNAGGYMGQAWFGLAHGTGDATATEYGENANSSDVSNGTQNDTESMANGGSGNPEYSTPYLGTFAAANPGGYSYVFAAIGTVPEPTTLALIGLGGLGLLAAKRRRV